MNKIIRTARNRLRAATQVLLGLPIVANIELDGPLIIADNEDNRHALFINVTVTTQREDPINVAVI